MRGIAHADQCDPKLIVMLYSIQRPIVGAIVLLRFEETIEIAFGVSFDRIVDVPFTVLTLRNAEAVVHHCGFFTGDHTFVAIERVTEYPDVAAIGQGDGIGGVGSEPRWTQGKRWGAGRVATLCVHRYARE